MRAGNLKYRIIFYPKVVVRDVYGASVDSWPSASITTRGDVRYIGGNKSDANDEITYGKSVEVTVRYRADIVETMKLRIDNGNQFYIITYLEVIGNKEAIRLTVEKQGDDFAVIAPPTNFNAVSTSDTSVTLSWTNNIDGNAIVIERSLDGITFAIIHTTAAGVTSYLNSGLAEATEYFYRIKSTVYGGYSSYAELQYVTTVAVSYPPNGNPSGLVVTSVSQTELHLSWTAGSTNEDGFSIERSTDAITYTEVGTVLAGVTQYNDTTVTEGTTYFYKVRGYLVAMYSQYSNIDSKTSYHPIYTILNDGNTIGWFDAADLSTIQKDGSNYVYKWDDKLGVCLSMATYSGGAQPLLSGGSLNFDGISDNISTAFTSTAQPVFIYMIFRQNSWTSFERCFSDLSGGNYLQQRPTVAPNLSMLSSGLPVTNGGLPVGQFGILRMLWNGAGSKFIVNNGAAATGNPGTNPWFGIMLGTGAGTYADISIKELIIRKVADIPATETAIYNYLVTKNV